MAILVVGLWVGVVFGTSFRWLKIEELGRSEAMNAQEVAAIARKSASETWTQAAEQDREVRMGQACRAA